MKTRRTWAMIMAMIMSISLTLGDTVAYLQDEESAVNVMTVGNVAIELVEKERVEQSDLNTADTNLREFQNNNPLLPAVYPEEQYAAFNTAYQQFPTGGSAAMWKDTTMNVVDKIVFVKNKGRSDAYIRVWFAFEQGSMEQTEFENTVGLNINNTHWAWEDIAYDVEIDGNEYAIKAATYLGNAGADGSEHKNGVLPAGLTTRPSLLQLMIYKWANNKELQAIDGNGDGKYNVLVVSQGTQAMGFDNAEQALNMSFNEGKPCTELPIGTIQTWFGGMATEEEEEEEIDTTDYDPVADEQDLQDIIQQMNDIPVDDSTPDEQLPKASVVVTQDMSLSGLDLEAGELNIHVNEGVTLEIGEEDLSGWSLLSTAKAAENEDYIYVRKRAKINVTGKGEVVSNADAVFNLSGGKLTINMSRGRIACNAEDGSIFLVEGVLGTGAAMSTVDIKKGSFTADYLTNGGDMTINIAGGTFSMLRDSLADEIAFSQEMVAGGMYKEPLKLNITGGTFAGEGGTQPTATPTTAPTATPTSAPTAPPTAEPTPSLPATITTAEAMQAVLDALWEETVTSHEVKLGADITMPGNMSIINGSLVIDLNGHTLKATGNWDEMSSAISLRNANVTIKGTGNVIGYDNETFALKGTSSLTIDVNGNVENHWTYTNQMAGKYFFYDYDISSSVVINSGNFLADDDLDSFITSDLAWGDTANYQSKLTINGGSFAWPKSFISNSCTAGKVTFVHNGGTFAAEPTATPAPSLPEYVYSESELEAAIALAAQLKQEHTVKLGSDIELTESGLVFENVVFIIDLNGHNLSNYSPRYITIGIGADIAIEGKGNVSTSLDEVFDMAGGSLLLSVDGDVYTTDEENGIIFANDSTEWSQVTIGNGNIVTKHLTYGGDLSVSIFGGVFNIPRSKLDAEVALSQVWVDEGYHEMATNFMVSGGTFAAE